MNMINDATHVARHEAARAAAAAGGEFLTFRLGTEEYGIDILKVQEIRSYEQPTRIANAPSFIKGVVNLRGVIVPIVDLRIKLNCDSVEYNTSTPHRTENIGSGRAEVMWIIAPPTSARAELDQYTTWKPPAAR